MMSPSGHTLPATLIDLSKDAEMIVVGLPGTGRDRAPLAEQLGAQVLSTDQVRRQLQQAGAITGSAGDLDAGLYSPENVTAVCSMPSILGLATEGHHQVHDLTRTSVELGASLIGGAVAALGP